MRRSERPSIPPPINPGNRRPIDPNDDDMGGWGFWLFCLILLSAAGGILWWLG